MSWQALNLAWADDAQDRPEPTLGGIAYPGSRVLISGEPQNADVMARRVPRRRHG